MVKIGNLIEKSGCDAVLIMSELSAEYFSGFYADFCYIVATKDFINYYTDKRYYDEAKIKLKYNIKLIDSENYLSILAKDLKGYANIGLDETKIFYSDYLKIKDILPEKFKLVGGIVEQIRSIKDETELRLVRIAAQIADKALDEILGVIKEGISERELAYEIDSRMIKRGADSPAFNTIVCFAENAAYPHWVPSERKLKPGDIILMDFGARYNGYNSDMTRTVSFGRASDEFKKAYEVVKGANLAAQEGITPYMKASAADALARDYIKSAGYEEYFTHSLGHGVGFEVHEYPRLAPNSDALINRGMLFTVEPGIYINGKFGIRIEDLVYMDDNVIKLTQSDKNLIEL
ncbi:MAG: M24 family metallopeptidase [Christensenellales bacterium]|jgi:Xaa-Pro aminopeptidase